MILEEVSVFPQESVSNMCLLSVFRRKRFKPSKLSTLAKLAISRSSMLKRHQETKFFQAKSDVIELLEQGQQDSAIVRAHLVIKYGNMIDVLSMIVEYCHLLIERVKLLEKTEECPRELKEAISSLIYASSTVAEFPELKKLRRIFVSLFGREFAARAIELRNNCEVNSQIIQKLSSGHPCLKSKYRALKVIADERGFYVKDPFAVDTKKEPDDVIRGRSNMSIESGRSYGSIDLSRSYSNVAEALEDAFESASFAAAAARVAVELSAQESQDSDSGSGSGSNSGFSGSSRGSSGRRGASYVAFAR